jgi:predicted ATPase
MIELTGPLGSGKSRLRRELQGILDRGPARVRVLRGAASAREDTALSLWASVLRESMGWHAGDEISKTSADRAHVMLQRTVAEAIEDPAQAESCALFLGELLSIPAASEPRTLEQALIDPELMRDRLRVSVHDYVVGVCRLGPTALLLEDLHWADRASVELLARIIESLADAPLLLLVSSREAVRELGHVELPGVATDRIELRPLAADVARALARAVAGPSLPEALLDELAHRSEGNPLFIEQMALALREQQGEPGRVPVPVTVEAALQARLDHLPDAARDVCKRASVLGRPFLLDEVEALGASDPHGGLRLLVEREILGTREAAGTVDLAEHAFRSRLMEDVTYRMLTPEVRQELHRRAAEYLERARGVDPEEAATHWERAGSPARAARPYALSAVRASRRGDSDTVMRCSERAFTLGAPEELLYELHMARADALRFLGRRTEQGRHLEDALAHARSVGEKARVRTQQIAWLTRAGRLEDAIATGSLATALAREAGDSHALVLALCRQADAMAFAGRLDGAEAALREAAASARGAMPVVEAAVEASLGRLACTRGDVAEALSADRRALELYRSAGAMRLAAAIEQNVADLCNRVGAYAEAEAALRKALTGGRRVGHRLNEGYVLANLGYALTMQERPAEALETLAAAADLAHATGDSRLALSVRTYRLRALLGLGRAEEVAVLAEVLARECETGGQAGLLVIAYALAARARLLRGDAPLALEHSTRAMALRDQLGGIEEDEGEVFLVHVDALAACGRTRAADEVRDRARTRLTELASRINDPVWRRRFLEDVPAHRGLLVTRLSTPAP